MFIPIIPWWAFLVIVLGWSLNSLWKKSTKTKLVEIKYGNLSEKRKHKARERADKDGYIYLGNVRRQLGAGAYWDMTMEDNVVCRVNNEKIDFYSIGDKTIFLPGLGILNLYRTRFRFLKLIASEPGTSQAGIMASYELIYSLSLTRSAIM